MKSNECIYFGQQFFGLVNLFTDIGAEILFYTTVCFEALHSAEHVFTAGHRRT